MIRGTGNMMVPALVTCAGVVVLIPLSPCLIFGLGTVSKTRRCRRRGRRRHLLCAGQPRACGLSAVGPQRRRPCLSRHQNSLVAIRRHSSRRPGRGADHGADQSHHRHRHRLCRRFRSGGHCRLRHRLAPGISAHSAGVRSRRAARRHGRHQYRRRPPRARPARGLDRRGDRAPGYARSSALPPPPSRAPGCRCSAPRRR